MAVIILPTADFSANNIGQIDIFDGFSDTTLEVFNNFSIVPDEQNQMQLALDRYFRTLVASNLYGTKIKNLCLPILSVLSSNANNVELACKNVISGNAMVSNGSTVSSSVQLYHGGIRPIRGSAPARIYTNNDSDMLTTDLHFMHYMLEAEKKHGLNSSGYNINVIQPLTPKIIGISILNERLWIANSPSNDAYGDANYIRQPACRIVSYKNTENDGKTAYYCAGQQYLSNGTNFLGEKIGPDFIFGAYGLKDGVYVVDEINEENFNFGVLESPVGIITSGLYLDGEEAGALTSASDTLVSAINAYVSSLA